MQSASDVCTMGELLSIGGRRSTAAAGAAGATASAAAIAIAVTLVGVTHPAERRSLNGPHSYEVSYDWNR